MKCRQEILPDHAVLQFCRLFLAKNSGSLSLILAAEWSKIPLGDLFWSTVATVSWNLNIAALEFTAHSEHSYWLPRACVKFWIPQIIVFAEKRSLRHTFLLFYCWSPQIDGKRASWERYSVPAQDSRPVIPSCWGIYTVLTICWRRMEFLHPVTHRWPTPADCMIWLAGLLIKYLQYMLGGRMARYHHWFFTASNSS